MPRVSSSGGVILKVALQLMVMMQLLSHEPENRIKVADKALLCSRGADKYKARVKT